MYRLVISAIRMSDKTVVVELEVDGRVFGLLEPDHSGCDAQEDKECTL